MPTGAWIVIDRPEKEIALELMRSGKNLDAIIPRGGAGLRKAVLEQAKMPVLCHDGGLTQLYVDDETDIPLAQNVVINSKVQSFGAANSLDTLLVQQSMARPFLAALIRRLLGLADQDFARRAAEPDFPFDRTTVVMGSTDVTVDQGGSGGSDALQTDGWPMRRVAAEARRVLLDMASMRLGAPVAALVVSNGVVSVKDAPTRRVTYGELIGGKRFNVTLTGANVDATTGVAKLKPVQELKIVGTSPQRFDIPQQPLFNF